jgi:transcription-repair coupling factor (superfamily II helicase)
MKATHEQRSPETLPHETRDALRSTVIDLPVAAYIPEPYVPDIEARLALYQRIATLRSVEDTDELARETEDRLGPLPEPLAGLLALVRLRLTALHAGVAAIRIEDGDVVLTAIDARPFGERSLPPLPSGVRVGRRQIRLPRAELGGDYLAPLEALVRMLAGERERVAV